MVDMNKDQVLPDWPTTAGLILRLNGGWELYDDHGTLRWYSPTKPGFDDVLPTPAEVALLDAVTLESHRGYSGS